MRVSSPVENQNRSRKGVRRGIVMPNSGCPDVAVVRYTRGNCSCLTVVGSVWGDWPSISITVVRLLLSFTC
jgi:hypothetical protein